MSTFDINRFGQALKCYFLVSRQSWIRLFGIFTLVMFFAGLFWTRVQSTPYQVMETWGEEALFRNYQHYIEQAAAFGIIFFCFSMLFGATGMFSQMKDTRTRSAFLLWPVSNLEKYLISILLSVFFVAVLTVGAYVVADALRVFVDWLTGRIIIWGVPFLFQPFNGSWGVFSDWHTTWMVFTWAFYIHSLYIVGGTLFRRQQFLLTSTSIAVVAILLIMTLNQINPHIDFITGTWDEKTSTYTPIYHPSFYIIHAVLTALIFFHYWASYKLFTRMQVINNKWLNV